MASVEEVEAILADLLVRLDGVEDETRSLLPSRRTIEARCPDLDLVRFAEWRAGRIVLLDEADLPGRVDIRVSVRSDDLVGLASGTLPFAQAYAANRLRIDASVTDLLRLRAVL